MQKRYLSLIAVSLFAAALTGCGSSGGSGGSSTAGSSGGSGTFTTDSASVTIGGDGHALAGSADGIEVVGTDKCIDCHGNVVAASVKGLSWSVDEVARYLTGKHVIHSDHITRERAESEGCNVCHDPIGDGVLLEGLIDAANVPAEGLAAVTCEVCHGAGGEHFGISALPTPNPDYQVCGTCHDSGMPHATYHPEGVDIAENYEASKHKTASVRNEAKCAKCHTDEGGRLYKNVTTRAQLEATVLPVETGSAVQCRTCHDSHDVGNTLLMEAIEKGHGDYPPYDTSEEYATCTACHQGDNAAVIADNGTNNNTGLTATDPGLLSELIYHGDAHMRVITDTHYDDPSTTDKIEGYVVDREGVNVRSCLDCHDIHAVQEIRIDRDTTTINDQWARSGHGGRLLAVKDAALAPFLVDGADPDDRSADATQAMKAEGADDEADPWIHYDWDASNRQSCQKCHTATGAKNYLTATATLNDSNADNDVTYDAANNDFSHLEDWAKAADGIVTSSGQNEMLYCWGCHKNNAGDLRDPGPVTPGYLAANGTDDAVFADINGSNVCVACHSGRESGGEIKADTGNFTNKSFINSHYLAAAGIMYRTAGYEFADQSYADPSYYAHDDIGMGTDTDLTAWEEANGTNGPCVGCHMSSTETHSLKPVAKSGAGAITDVTASVCINCHTGGHGAALAASDADDGVTSEAGTFLETEAEEFAASLKALEAQLALKGYFFYPAHPYFYTAAYDATYTEAGLCNKNLPVKNWQTGGTSTFTWDAADEKCTSAANAAGTADTGPLNMGAAFNFNLLEHEPGAFAHNRYYTKRLIFDSIDFLDNGTLDGVIPDATVTALAAQVTHGGTNMTAGEVTSFTTYLDSDTDTAGIQRP